MARIAFGKVYVSDRLVRFKTIQNTMLNTWARFGIKSITHYQDDVFLCEFHTTDGVSRVLDKGPWNYLNDFIILRRIIPNLPLSSYKFDSVTLWLQLHNLPLNLISP